MHGGDGVEWGINEWMFQILQQQYNASVSLFCQKKGLRAGSFPEDILKKNLSFWNLRMNVDYNFEMAFVLAEN